MDILFKRDYYEQRLAIQRQISEAEKEAAEAEEGGVEPEEVLRFLNAKMSELILQENIEGEEEEGGDMAAAAPGQLLRQGKSFDQMDPR